MTSVVSDMGLVPVTVVRMRRMIVRLLALLFTVFALPAWAGVDVIVRGLEGDEKTNVEQRLEIKTLADRDDLDGLLVERLNQQAESDIRDALQPFGYYSPTISGTLTVGPKDWKAVYEVQPGPLTHIGKVDIAVDGEAADFPAVRELLAQLPVHEGDRLLHSNYEAAKLRLIQAAYAGGFLDAKFSTSQLRIDIEKQSAEIELKLSSGPRYYFGPVSVEQQGLKPELVARYVTIEEGQPFDPQKLLKTQFVLTDLGYFQTVVIEPLRKEEKDRHIPIVIHTTPRKGTRYQLGGGYGTDTGARVSAGLELRQLNDEGHKFRSDLRLSEIDNVFTNEYKIPLGTVPSDSLSFTAGASYQKLATGDDSKYTVGTSLNRTPGRWQRRIYLDFVHERTNLEEAPTSSNLLMPGISFTRGEYDDPIHTRRGWFGFFDVHGADTAVISTASFLQLHGILRGAYPFGDRLTLLARAEMGASFTPAFEELPPSQRFFAGGDQSVRGYAYQSIGPVDAKGNVLGGKYLSVYSIEPDYRVFENWSAAVFYDFGGVEDKPWPKLYGGTGAGVRYRAPIGEVRVDVAHPLDGDSSGVRLHLGVRVGL
jgi:translocation and assembly module TamA